MSRLRNLTAYQTKFIIPENMRPFCRVGLSDPLKKEKLYNGKKEESQEERKNEGKEILRMG
jgi:hypothetical protein